MSRWWRCYEASPFDPRWRVIATRLKCKPADVWAVASCVLGHASAHSGNVNDLDPEVIAVGLGYETQHVTDVAFQLVSLRFIENGVVQDWADWQHGATSTKRVREFRNKKKQGEIKLIRPRNVGETFHETQVKRNETDETVPDVSFVSPDLPTGSHVGDGAPPALDNSSLTQKSEEDLNPPLLVPPAPISASPQRNRGSKPKVVKPPARLSTPRWFSIDEPMDPDFYAKATEYGIGDPQEEWEKLCRWHAVNCKSTYSPVGTYVTWIKRAISPLVKRAGA